MKRLAFASLALWLSAAAWAQSGKITGVVSDAITGEALIQASVLVNGTGVATDFDGAYTLDLPYGAYDITVQYIGYESQTRSRHRGPCARAGQLQVEHHRPARGRGHCRRRH